LTFRSTQLPDPWKWWRIAEAAWRDPLDPAFAAARGGRWNPPGSFPTLYFNEDPVTARLNLRAFIAQWPYEPEDLRSDTGPVLIGATLPRDQRVCDACSRAGIRAAGLPATYPVDRQGDTVVHGVCQPVGEAVKAAGLRGLRVRSARGRDGVGRELAWFPATRRSVARQSERLAFEAWYWG
jgi:hypothetical protein